MKICSLCEKPAGELKSFGVCDSCKAAIAKTNDEGSKVVCPHSQFHQDPLATGYKLHFCEPAELEANGGVCASCRKKFALNNSAMRHHRVETAAEFEKPHAITLTDDHAAHVYQSDPELHPIVEFPFDELDRGNPLAAELTDATPPVRYPDIADALQEILAWVWRDGEHQRAADAAVIRFVAMSATINPALLDNESYKKIGARFGAVSKAGISKAAVLFQEKFGVKFRRARPASCRENLAAAMRASHAARKETTT